MNRIFVVLLMVTAMPVPAGEKTYLDPSAFVASAFEHGVPDQQVLWIKGELRERLGDVLGHAPGFMRVRYWRKNGRSVFILDEIGKEMPITTGFIIQDGALDRVKVLIFRESRGWEVKYPFFSDQFAGASLNRDKGGLDRPIDGISGATLSVRAVRRMAESALVLEKYIRDNRTDGAYAGDRADFRAKIRGENRADDGAGDKVVGRD